MKRLTSVVLSTAFLFSLNASAGLIVDTNGILQGVTELEFNSVNYDVAFSDNSCVNEYDGCDEQSDFIFQSQSEAEAFAALLLSQVFLDGPSGNFDTNPTLTSGCPSGSRCEAFIPYAPFSNVNFTRATAATNWAPPNDLLDGVLLTSFVAPIPFSDESNRTLAVISISANQPPPTDVPLPGTFTLIGLGLLGLARRQKA